MQQPSVLSVSQGPHLFRTFFSALSLLGLCLSGLAVATPIDLRRSDLYTSLLKSHFYSVDFQSHARKTDNFLQVLNSLQTIVCKNPDFTKFTPQDFTLPMIEGAGQYLFHFSESESGSLFNRVSSLNLSFKNRTDSDLLEISFFNRKMAFIAINGSASLLAEFTGQTGSECGLQTLLINQFDPRSRLKSDLVTLSQNPSAIQSKPKQQAPKTLSEIFENLLTRWWPDLNKESIEKVRATLNKPKALVALLDSGIDYNLKELAPLLARGPDDLPLGHDFRYNRRFPAIDAPFGFPEAFDSDTHATSIACLLRPFAEQVALLPIAIRFDMDRKMAQESLGQAVEFAAKSGARIINMSFGVKDPEALRDLFESMKRHPEILFVAAAHNMGQDLSILENSIYPAKFELPNLITVAAFSSGSSQSTHTLANFSNYSSKYVHIAAPGERLVSCLPEGRATRVSGTSYSAPLVAAAGARIALAHPTFSGEAIKNRIFDLSKKEIGLQPYIEQGRVLVETPEFDL